MSNVGVARYVGSVPSDLDELTGLFEEGDDELPSLVEMGDDEPGRHYELARLLEGAAKSLEMRETGDVELYRVDPPLQGYHVIAVTQQGPWIRQFRNIGEEGQYLEDPVSTTFYGVSGGESVRIERDRPLADTADGRNPVNALADLGYVVR